MIEKMSAGMIKISMDEKEYRIWIKVKNNPDLREIEKNMTVPDDTSHVRNPWLPVNREIHEHVLER